MPPQLPLQTCPRPSRRPTRQPQAFCLMPSSTLPLSLRRAPYTTLTTPASSSPIVSVLLRGFPSPRPSSPRLAPRAWEGWHCTRVSGSCHRQESSQPACACLFSSHSQSKAEDGKELAVSPVSGNCKNSCFPSWNYWWDQCWLYGSPHHPSFPLTLSQAFPTLLQLPLPYGARGWHLSHPVHYNQSLRVGDPTEGNERGELVWSCLTRSLDNLNICESSGIYLHL